MKKVIIAVILWTLVISWMVGIFYFSHQTKQQSGDISSGISDKLYDSIEWTPGGKTKVHNDEWFRWKYQVFVRKSAHIFLFAGLGVLSTLAVSLHTDNKILRFIIPFGISVLYAISDEVHQHYVPGRSGNITDVLWDILGIFIGYFAARLVVVVFNKIKKRRNA